MINFRRNFVIFVKNLLVRYTLEFFIASVQVRSPTKRPPESFCIRISAIIWAITKKLLKYKNKSRTNRGWDIVLEMNKRNKSNY